MFTTLKKSFTRWRRFNRTVEELQSLSNRELSDLGMSRHDIRRIAREAVSL